MTPLAACLDSDSDVTAPEAVPIESANFASGLGVNIAGSTRTATAPPARYDGRMALTCNINSRGRVASLTSRL